MLFRVWFDQSILCDVQVFFQKKVSISNKDIILLLSFSRTKDGHPCVYISCVSTEQLMSQQWWDIPGVYGCFLHSISDSAAAPQRPAQIFKMCVPATSRPRSTPGPLLLFFLFISVPPVLG